MGTLGNANDLYGCKQDKHNVQDNSSFVPNKIRKNMGQGAQKEMLLPLPAVCLEYMCC